MNLGKCPDCWEAYRICNCDETRTPLKDHKAEQKQLYKTEFDHLRTTEFINTFNQSTLGTNHE